MQRTHSQNSRRPKNLWGPLARLIVCAALLAVVWLAVLPFIGRQPGIDAYIQQNERLGIDPSAKFYTEIPAMPELYEQVQRKRRN